ncbi:MAG TPA: DUF2891 domain-containing protein [Micromonosporaceae bacterium]|nr:DUF2891 domain-containing protein [Micromonosporaceae bacterium]
MREPNPAWPPPQAADWAAVGLANIVREYPNEIRHRMDDPDDRPRPRDVHPAFYGSFDWHSCVEMHWMLVRLLRTASDVVAVERIRAGLGAHLTAPALTAEARYVTDRPAWERPYGWGWALTLAHELSTWDDPDGVRWSAAFRPLAGALAAQFTRWLPKAAYPVRHGVHQNSAFALSLALPYARASDPALLAAITDAAYRWFAGDTDYPGGYEPSGSDFLSPALTEAELMSAVLPPDEFTGWLARFLPGLPDGQPVSLFKPVAVSDPSDGQIAHLHGLNLSRAWCWRRLARALPDGDPRVPVIAAAVRRHAAASLDQAAGSDYMVEHWLAAYAVLLLAPD